MAKVKVPMWGRPDKFYWVDEVSGASSGSTAPAPAPVAASPVAAPLTPPRQSLDKIGDGTTYARTLGSGLLSGHAAYTADSGGTIHLIKGVGDASTLGLDGEIADGTTYLRMPGANMDANRRGLIDFTQSGHLNKTIDYVGDGSTYLRMPGSNMDINRRALIDFTQSGHLGKNTDNIPPGTGTGATTLAVIGHQRNLVPDSDLKAALIYWADTSGGAITVTQNLDGINNCFEYIGTGAASGYLYRTSKTIPITPGTYTLSAVVYGGNITTGSAMIAVENLALSANYGDIRIGPTATGRLSATVTIPSGVTECTLLVDTFNCTVASGVGLFVQQIQLEAGSVMTAYQATDFDNLTGSSLIDFSKTAHVGKIIDNIGDGTTYARILGSQLTSGAHKLTVAGSGMQVADQRNLPQGAVNNFSATYSGFTPSYSSTTTNGAGDCTISFPAFTLELTAGGSASYGATSAQITNLSVPSGGASTGPYYFWYVDPTYGGGNLTLNYSTSIAAAQGAGNVFLGAFMAYYPGAGTVTNPYNVGNGGSPDSRTKASPVLQA